MSPIFYTATFLWLFLMAGVTVRIWREEDKREAARIEAQRREFLQALRDHYVDLKLNRYYDDDPFVSDSYLRYNERPCSCSELRDEYCDRHGGM